MQGNLRQGRNSAVIYIDHQAHCFYVVTKSKWDVDEYLLMLGLKVSTSGYPIL